MIWQLIVTLLFLLALGALARYLPKFLQKGKTNSPQRSLELVETLHLGVDRTLYLVRAEETQLLLAGSRNGMVFLAQLKQKPDANDSEWVSEA